MEGWRDGGREEVDNQDQTPLCADERWKHGGRRLVSVCERLFRDIPQSVCVHVKTHSSIVGECVVILCVCVCVFVCVSSSFSPQITGEVSNIRLSQFIDLPPSSSPPPLTPDFHADFLSL